ncbi:hypothetical protein HAX54_008789, partial [Datura stramonium]|nr:hypothetical protein [Datura stramonium]
PVGKRVTKAYSTHGPHPSLLGLVTDLEPSRLIIVSRAIRVCNRISSHLAPRTYDANLGIRKLVRAKTSNDSRPHYIRSQLHMAP